LTPAVYESKRDEHLLMQHKA